MSKNPIISGAMIFSVLFGISGRATQRPVLSSNEHLIRVRPEIARQDIDNCMERAKSTSTESGTDSNQNAVAGAATSSVVGAAAGGAVVGQTAQAAAAGAVGGAVGSLTQALCRHSFGLNGPGSAQSAFGFPF